MSQNINSVETLDSRAYWSEMMIKVTSPVFLALAEGKLRATMPVEAADGRREDQCRVSHLQAFGRSLAGVGPWIGTDCVPHNERKSWEKFQSLIRSSLDAATNPSSSDFMNFVKDGQALVDAAFLAQGLFRADRKFWDSLDPGVRSNVLDCLRSTRRHQPPVNNWLLFSAMIESFLCWAGESWDGVRVDYAIRQHEQWYKGDGAYGDGPQFHWDYYNSYVIHPMLLDIFEATTGANDAWSELYPEVLRRSKRFAAVQERLIGPDGSFPPIGRSLSYRSGAFQLLAQMAVRRDLPEELPAAQVRCALTAVIQRVFEGPGVFDEGGWLKIGLCGHQPSLGEYYISTGSLYLCTCVFLPLGLPGNDEFWCGADQDWTAKKVWCGQDIACDLALTHER